MLSSSSSSVPHGQFTQSRRVHGNMEGSTISSALPSGSFLLNDQTLRNRVRGAIVLPVGGYSAELSEVLLDAHKEAFQHYE